jgi:hypothetical protein
MGSQARSFPHVQFQPPLRSCRINPVVRLSARPTRLHCTIIAQSGPKKVQITKPSPAWRSFWATIDAGAWLGTVGSAVAFLLTQEALLVGGPILLPIIALYASKQRGKLDSQAAQAELQTQVAAALRQVAILSEESAAEVAEEVAALVDEVRQGRSSPEKAVRTVEAKLTAVEGTIRNIEESTKGLLEDAAVQRSKSVKEISAALVSLRRDVSADLQQATGDELAALGKVDGRLAALEGAISGLEVAQSEGLRRLGSSMSGVLLDNKDLLAATIRDEVWQSLEPVRQLPQALAAAAPGLTAAAEQSRQSIDEESLRALVAQEIASAGQQLLEKQQELLKEAMSTPATIAPAQWNQLGKKLVALDDQLTDLKAEQEGQINNLLGEGSTAAHQVALLRSELIELSQSVKSALEQQQVAQKAALALATQSGVGGAGVAEELLLGPLEASLLQLQNELRSAAEVAAVDRQASDSKWLVDLEIKLVKLVNPVLEAIATAREASAEAAPSSSSSSSTAATEATLDQAAAGITSMSVKLEELGNQLAALEQRLEFNNTSDALSTGSNSWEQSSSIGSTAISSFEANSSVIGVIKDIDQESIAKKEAYQRMQALLRSDTVSATIEGKNDDEDVGSVTPPVAGVPISDWLSLDDDEEDSAVKETTSSSTAPVVVTGGMVEKEEAVVAVGIGNGVAQNISFVQDQIAFEAALAAGEDSEEENSYSTSSNGVSAAAVAEEEEEDKTETAMIEEAVEEEVLDESIEEAPVVDLQVLYTQGLELLRQGRAYAAAAAAAASTSISSVSPGQKDALNAADAALTEAARCFQAASSITGDTSTQIKAIGNSGNALMARARVKRQLSRIANQQQQQRDGIETGSGRNEVADSLQSEAKDLLVLAGRRYREVLVNDPSQGRAFLNWGRAVCLRAEIAKESEDFSGAFSLFSNAAEKFQAALQLDAEPAEGLKLAGTALVSAATCLGRDGGDGGGGNEEDEEERRVLLEEAEGYLVAAVDVGAGDDAVVQLEECRKLLDGW